MIHEQRFSLLAKLARSGSVLEMLIYLPDGNNFGLSTKVISDTGQDPICGIHWETCKKYWGLRMYCIDMPGVPESHDACVFHCLYD